MWWCVGIKVLLIDQDEKLWQGSRCTYGWCWCQARKLWRGFVMTGVLLLFLGDHLMLILYTAIVVLLIVGAIGLIAGLLWMVTR